MSFFENQLIQAFYSSSPHANDDTPHKSAALVDAPASHSPTSIAVTSNNGTERIPDLIYENMQADSIFKLLENLEWKEVISRLKGMTSESQSNETYAWVSKNDKRGMKLLFRRLPIHEACVRKAPPEVVIQLLAANPCCAGAKDNNGRTSLHHAFIHEVEMDVIYLLFNANRDAVEIADFWGKTPREYAMLSKSPFKKEIMQMFNLTEPQLTTTIDTIKSSLEKKSSLVKNMKTIAQIKTQPNATELYLEEELEQARVESDIAYVQRDAALLAQEKLSNKVKELELQLLQKNEMLQEMEDMSRRNTSLNALLTKYESKNAELEKSIALQTKTIEDMKDQSDSIQNKIETEMKEKETELNKTILEYKNSHEKMKNTIILLTDKLRRMDSNLDDTISVLEHDLECEVDEKLKICVEEKVKYLEELVELYKGNIDDSKKKYEVCNKEKMALELQVRELSSRGTIKDIQLSSDEEQESLKMCIGKVALAEIERDEYQREVEVYKKCLDSSKARVASLEALVALHENGSQELEDELEMTKKSYVYVMDQLMERDEIIDVLEANLEQLSARGDFRSSSRRDLLVPDLSNYNNSRIIPTSSSPFRNRRRARSISPFMRR